MSEADELSSIPLEFLKKRTTFPRSISELVTTQLVPGSMAKSQALHTNMGVDYIVVYRFPPSGKLKLLPASSMC